MVIRYNNNTVITCSLQAFLSEYIGLIEIRVAKLSRILWLLQLSNQALAHFIIYGSYMSSVGARFEPRHIAQSLRSFTVPKAHFYAQK